jgi:hypothetical protein
VRDRPWGRRSYCRRCSFGLHLRTGCAIASKLVVNHGRGTQVLCATLGDGLVGEIAPRVITVAVAPVLGFGVDGGGGAIGSGVLGFRRLGGKVQATDQVLPLRCK